jgi:hypothetical protein
MARRTLGLALACALSFHVRALAQEPMRAHLAWVRGEGAEACAPEEEIAAAVIARVGRDPFEGEATHRIEGVVSRDGETWRARILVRLIDGSGAGERALESAAPSCASIDDAAALAIALIIDPDSLSRAPHPSPEPEAEPVETPTPCPTPIEAARSVRGGISVAAIGAIGLLPEPWAGVSIEGFVSIAPWLRLELGLWYWPELRGGELGRIAGVGLTAGRLGLRVPYFEEGILSLEAGAALLAGAMHTVVYTLEPLEPGDQPWIAIDASARARLMVADPLSIELALGLLVPFVRTRFSVEGGGPSFQQDVVTGWLSLAIGAQFS